MERIYIELSSRKAFTVPHFPRCHAVVQQSWTYLLPCQPTQTDSVVFSSCFFFVKSTSVRKIPPNWFCPHHHWYFISVCLSVPHLLASLLFLLLFAKCPEFPSVLRICAVLQPSSRSSPTPTGGFSQAEMARNLELRIQGDQSPPGFYLIGILKAIMSPSVLLFYSSESNF